MNLKLLIILFSLAPNIGLCCAGGYKYGYGLSLSELIDKTPSIVLARFTEGKDRKIMFKVENVIKVENKTPVSEELDRFERIVARSHNKFSKNHKSNDFDGHSDIKFWSNEKKLQKELVSRVAWKGGMCTPAFTFLSGEQYLLFLSSPGSFYAAEIIKTEGDKWLRYVIKHTSS